MSSLALDGLHIVVTRPLEQSGQLQRLIQQAGGKVILFPLLEIKPILDTRHLQETIARIADFDLAIFISPNAVRFGMAAIQAGPGMPQGLLCATVGQSSAQALRDAKVSNVITPPYRSDSESLLALPELQHVNDWKIVIFRGDNGRQLLGDTLIARGASVEYVTCYLRSKPPHGIEVLLNSHPDALTLSSSEALVYLSNMLDDSTRSSLITLPIFVQHGRIAEKADELGWKNIIQTESGDDGIVSSLVTWSKLRQ